VEHETFHVVAGKVLFACGETRVEIGAGPSLRTVGKRTEKQRVFRML
jgi:hypothetical protein